MLDEKTVLSTTAPRLTLLQYLKTIDKLLSGASLKNIETLRVSDNIIKLKFLFSDGSEILSEDIPTGSGGSTTPVETNDGTNGSKILGITIDGKRYSFKDYETNVADLLTLIQGSETVTVDLAEDGEHLEIHLDEIYKQTLVTKTEANESLSLVPDYNNTIDRIITSDGNNEYRTLDNGYININGYYNGSINDGVFRININNVQFVQELIAYKHFQIFIPVSKNDLISILIQNGTQANIRFDKAQFIYAKKVGV